jgi:ribonuclease VapC
LIAVDTSALVAILWNEQESPRLRASLAEANGAVISAGNVLELQLVLAGAHAEANWSQVEALFRAYGVEARPFDEAQLRIAREAALRFGKGRHRAGLNFGDCFAYALARAEGLNLLCVGEDFALTDLELA